MSLTKRSYTKELLDGDNIPFADIKRNMQELNTINTWLGGHAITTDGFAQLAGNRKYITVCEIGCGGGDNLAAISRWCVKHNVQLHCIGIDINPSCVEVAKSNTHISDGAEWLVSDYRDVKFANKPDIIFSSLFCHHFTDEELIQQLQWMYNNSSIGFFINDLHRHWLAYTSIKLLTALFSKSYLVKNDAPLSVARGFVQKEWINIFNKANISSYTITWKWAFRYLITCKHA